MRNVQQRSKKRIRTVPFSQEWWERYGLRALMICGVVILWGVSSSLRHIAFNDSSAPSMRSKADLGLFGEPAPTVREAEYLAPYEQPPYPQPVGSGYDQPVRVNASAYAPRPLSPKTDSTETSRSIFGDPMPPPDDALQ